MAASSSSSAIVSVVRMMLIVAHSSASHAIAVADLGLLLPPPRRRLAARRLAEPAYRAFDTVSHHCQDGRAGTNGLYSDSLGYGPCHDSRRGRFRSRAALGADGVEPRPG